MQYPVDTAVDTGATSSPSVAARTIKPGSIGKRERTQERLCRAGKARTKARQREHAQKNTPTQKGTLMKQPTGKRRSSTDQSREKTKEERRREYIAGLTASRLRLSPQQQSAAVQRLKSRSRCPPRGSSCCSVAGAAAAGAAPAPEPEKTSGPAAWRAPGRSCPAACPDR